MFSKIKLFYLTKDPFDYKSDIRGRILVEEITIRCTDCPERRVFIWFWHLVVNARPDRIERRVPEGKGFCRRGSHIGGSPHLRSQRSNYVQDCSRSIPTDRLIIRVAIRRKSYRSRKLRRVKVGDHLWSTIVHQRFEWLRRSRLTDTSGKSRFQATVPAIYLRLEQFPVIFIADIASKFQSAGPTPRRSCVLSELKIFWLRIFARDDGRDALIKRVSSWERRLLESSGLSSVLMSPNNLVIFHSA